MTGVAAVKLFQPVLLCTLLLFATSTHAADPQAPCAGPANPAFPQAGAPPGFSIWQQSALEKSGWQPPACLGLKAPSRSRLVLALAGSFRFDGTMDALLARLGAMSAIPRVKYWSTSNAGWRALANDATALSSPDPKQRRADFTAAEFRKGATLHYWMDDTRFGPVVYRARIVDSTAEQAVVTSENLTPIRQFLITIFEPGALQSAIVLERLSPGVFGVYILTRAGEGSSMLASWREASYVNRTVALYRQLAGIKSDQEPPAVR